MVDIRQVHQDLLAALEHQEDLIVAKREFTQILMDFIEQQGHVEPKELAVLKTQFSKSPQEKISYYKAQMDDQKFSGLEKEVLMLIKWIDAATSLDEIDEFMLKFHMSLTARESAPISPLLTTAPRLSFATPGRFCRLKMPVFLFNNFRDQTLP